MSLIGQRPHQVPVNAMLGDMAYWSRDHFEARVAALVAAGQTSPFAAGTRIVFQQTSAPAGWTKDTTLNDRALRIVSGTVGSGGSLAFSSAFASRSLSGSVSATTLSEAQMPAHSHEVQASTSNYAAGIATSLNFGGSLSHPGYGGLLSTRGGGQSHTHGLTLTALNMAVQYTDVIVAQKD